MTAKQRAFPGFNNLYALLGGDDFLVVDTHKPMEEFQQLRGQLEVAAGQRFGRVRRLRSPGGGSLVYSTMGFPLFISAAVAKALSAREVTGWRSTPVTLLDPTGKAIEGYEVFQVTGRCGPEEEKRSSIELRKYPGGNYPVRVGLYFDPMTWDGSDIFMCSSEVAFVFFAERAKAVMEEFADGAVAFERLDLLYTPLGEDEGPAH